MTEQKKEGKKDKKQKNKKSKQERRREHGPKINIVMRRKASLVS